jgi:hypothetical protein
MLHQRLYRPCFCSKAVPVDRWPLEQSRRSSVYFSAIMDAFFKGSRMARSKGHRMAATAVRFRQCTLLICLVVQVILSPSRGYLCGSVLVYKRRVSLSMTCRVGSSLGSDSVLLLWWALSISDVASCRRLLDELQSYGKAYKLILAAHFVTYFY